MPQEIGKTWIRVTTIAHLWSEQKRNTEEWPEIKIRLVMHLKAQKCKEPNLQKNKQREECEINIQENYFYFSKIWEKEFYINLFHNWHTCSNSSKLSSIMYCKDHCLGD